MELKDTTQNFIFKTRIDLNDEGDYIVLRELNMQEMKGVRFGDSDEDTRANIIYLESIFKDCLVEHSFTNGGEAATKAEVYNVLKGSGSLFMEIITRWLSSLPFSQRLKKGKSGASADSSSREQTPQTSES